MKVLLFHGRGLLSALIRWQTRGLYSHAAFYDESTDTVYEAWQGKGVRARKGIAPGPGVHMFEMEGLIATQAQRIREFCETHVAAKTGYSYIGVLRFVTRRKVDEPDRVFCSEFIIRGAAAADFWLFSRLAEPHWISPTHLAWSPKLIPL